MAASAAVPAIAQVAVGGPVAAATRPNILLIVTDDQPKHTNWAIQKSIAWLGGQGRDLPRGPRHHPAVRAVPVVGLLGPLCP
ncbi:hypothetical protein ABT010_28815 [Streptomyces sp. NPDC002668]|uniref:hypothetical protein n=1 Tax=Streptomyces sp. NPDC002668 TaxID=3154422 RepID=UPI00333000F8